MRKRSKILTVLGLLVPCAGAAAAGHRDDVAICLKNKASSDVMIAACGRVIAAGKWKRLHIAYNNRGLHFLDKGEFDAALADFDQAIRLNDRGFESFANRGDLWSSKQEYDRAIADYDQAIRLNSKDVLSYRARGRSLLVKLEYDRAIADLTRAIDLDPKEPYTFVSRAHAYWLRTSSRSGYDKAADLEKAVADLGYATQLGANEAFVFRTRSEIYMQEKDYDRAIADLDRAVALDAKDPFIFLDRSKVFLAKQDFDRAIADLDHAIELASDRAVASIMLSARGRLWLQRSDYTRALADYDRALRVRPDDDSGLLERGVVHRMLGNAEQARSDFSRVIALAKAGVAPPDLEQAAREQLALLPRVEPSSAPNHSGPESMGGSSSQMQTTKPQ